MMLKEITKYFSRKLAPLTVDQPNKKVQFAHKLLSELPSQHRNGSYCAYTSIKKVHLEGATKMGVIVEVKLKKRKNGNLNLGEWKKRRERILQNKLLSEYNQKLKYLGITSINLQLKIVLH
jgi:hypothetical protein